MRSCCCAWRSGYGGSLPRCMPAWTRRTKGLCWCRNCAAGAACPNLALIASVLSAGAPAFWGACAAAGHDGGREPVQRRDCHRAVPRWLCSALRLTAHLMRHDACTTHHYTFKTRILHPAYGIERARLCCMLKYIILRPVTLHFLVSLEELPSPLMWQPYPKRVPCAYLQCSGTRTTC